MDANSILNNILIGLDENIQDIIGRGQPLSIFTWLKPEQYSHIEGILDILIANGLDVNTTDLEVSHILQKPMTVLDEAYFEIEEGDQEVFQRLVPLLRERGAKRYTELSGNTDLWGKLKTSTKPEPLKRFKWQDLCSVFDGKSSSELRKIAEYSGIEHSGIYSKRELCKILAKNLERKIQLKQRIIDSDQCVNTTSLMMTELKDIQPEFFYTYIHQFPDKSEKLFCDDIRDLYESIKATGGKHPLYPRERLSEPNIVKIKQTYVALKHTTNTMKDELEPPQQQAQPENPTMILSRKLADLASLLPYPPQMTLISNADQQNFRSFVNELVSKGVLNHSQTSNLWVQQPLAAKVAIVELLINEATNNQAAAYEIVDAMVNKLQSGSRHIARPPRDAQPMIDRIQQIIDENDGYISEVQIQEVLNEAFNADITTVEGLTEEFVLDTLEDIMNTAMRNSIIDYLDRENLAYNEEIVELIIEAADDGGMYTSDLPIDYIAELYRRVVPRQRQRRTQAQDDPQAPPNLAEEEEEEEEEPTRRAAAQEQIIDLLEENQLSYDTERLNAMLDLAEQDREEGGYSLGDLPIDYIRDLFVRTAS